MIFSLEEFNDIFTLLKMRELKRGIVKIKEELSIVFKKQMIFADNNIVLRLTSENLSKNIR